MKSRKQRKLEAKLNGKTFTPQYNGTGAVSFEDYHGVGNERFDNKFVQFLKPSETPNELSEGVLKYNQDGLSIENSVFNLTSNSDGNGVTELEIVEESVNSEGILKFNQDGLTITNTAFNTNCESEGNEVIELDDTLLEESFKPKKDKSKKGKFKQKLKKLFSK